MQENIEERIGDEYSRIDPDDIVGKRFGKLVVEKMEVYKNHKYYYRCKCDCGKEPLIHRGRILFGATSCGCDTPRPVDPQDIVGKRFHKVLIAEYIGYQKNSSGRNRSYYRCICDCGNEFITSRTRLMYGEVKSCGDCTKIVQEEDHYKYICQNGDSFIFDEIDMELVKSHRWYISNGYPVTRSNGDRYKKTDSHDARYTWQ
ncbi:MAG: hypothetical protein LUD77_10395 [Clostridiales bacterium]|nr:hypothetical protein [Clostridiales bacterium]